MDPAHTGTAEGGPPRTVPPRTVPLTGLDSPYRLASAPAGTPYIAGFDNDRVVELPVSGGRRTLPVTGLRTPAGPAVPPPGRDACST